MKTIVSHGIKSIVLTYIVFMIPAMLIAAKGFSDLWLSGQQQPYIALTLLVLAIMSALVALTLASVFLYLLNRQFWVPPAKLLLIAAGMKLYFDVSLGKTVGMWGLVAALGLWGLWGVLAYKKNRGMLEGS